MLCNRIVPLAYIHIYMNICICIYMHTTFPTTHEGNQGSHITYISVRLSHRYCHVYVITYIIRNEKYAERLQRHIITFICVLLSHVYLITYIASHMKSTQRHSVTYICVMLSHIYNHIHIITCEKYAAAYCHVYMCHHITCRLSLL